MSFDKCPNMILVFIRESTMKNEDENTRDK